MMDTNEKNWLVRASTKILGPYSFDELVEQIKSQKVTLIDEVKKPDTRWAYVRENKLFFDAVNAVREAQTKTSEITKTHAAQTQTITINKTQIESFIDDLTPVPIEPPMPPGESRVNKTNLVKDITPTRESMNRNYSSVGSSSIKKYYLVATLLIVFAVVFTYLKKDNQNKIQYKIGIQNAIKFKNIGLYEKSIFYYKKASQIATIPVEVQFQIAPLLISNAKEIIEGRRIIEYSMQQTDLSEKQLLENNIMLGLSFLYENNLKDAELHFEKALGYEHHSAEAKINKAIVNIKTEKYLIAAEILSSLKNTKYDEYVLYLKLYVSAAQKNFSEVSQIIQQLKEKLLKPGFLNKEIALLSLYLNLNINDESLSSMALNNIFRYPPRESDNYVKNYLLDWTLLNWSYLENFCLDISAHYPAVNPICKQEVGKDYEADKKINEGLAVNPKDKYFLIAEAYSMLKNGKTAEAKTLLKMPELSSIPFTHKLSGMVCMQSNDVYCVQTEFFPMLEGDFQDPMVYYGLAWIELTQKNRAKSFEYLNKGMALYSNYIPYLELRDVLENQND